MARAFVEALRRHGREVLTLEGDQAKEFLRLVREMRERLMGKLKAMGGQERAVDAFRIKAVLAEAETAIAALEGKAERFWAKGAARAAELAAGHLGDELERMGRFFGGYEPITIDAAKVLGRQDGLLANKFESSVERYGVDTLNRVRAQLFTSMRAGDQLRDVVKELTGAGAPLGGIAESTAERMARTEISNAYGVAQLGAQRQAAKVIPDLVKVWHKVTSYDCPTCNPLHLTQRKMDGTWAIKSGKKTREIEHPPAHPHCGCRTIVMKKSWSNAIAKLGYLDLPVEDPLYKQRRKAA